jgi:hypothetical protein
MQKKYWQNQMGYNHEHSFGATWKFIAMEYYLGILNRTYKVFVTPTMISGGFVNGIMASPPGLTMDWFDPSSYVQKRLVARYDEVSPYMDEFKNISPVFNFQYQKAEIQEAKYDPTRKWGMGYVAHSGKLYIKLANGKRREFILLGLQQGIEILQHLVQGHDTGTASRDLSEVHMLLDQVYKQPQNLEIWLRLAELFYNLGEKAQEYYCRAYIQFLKMNE